MQIGITRRLNELHRKLGELQDEMEKLLREPWDD